MQIDTQCAALVGHSYGALTVGALTAENPDFSCGCAIDPWWWVPSYRAVHETAHAGAPDRGLVCCRGGLEAGSAAGTAWATDSPLLILGSHAWAQPHPRTGKIMGEGHDRVLAAAGRRSALCHLLLLSELATIS